MRGDILQDHFGQKYEAKWWDGTYVLGSITGGILNQFVDIQIIGNIYDNPELLNWSQKT